MGRLKFSSSLLFPVVSYLEKHGIKKADFFKDTSLDVAVLDSTDNRVTVDQFDELAERAMKLTGEPRPGLQFGRHFALNHLGIVGYMLMNCSTLDEAMFKYTQFQKILGSGGNSKISTQGRDVWFEFEVEPTLQERDHFLDFVSACGHMIITNLTAEKVKVKEVWYYYPEPEDISVHKDIFGAPIKFNMPKNALVYDRDQLNLKIVLPNPDLLGILEKHAKIMIDEFRAEESHADKVRNKIIHRLPTEVPTIDQVAGQLLMSRRNLQLKLKEEGTSFRQILDDVRREIAIEYIQKKHFSLSELSQMLGFSEPSVFYRTFKKWTGKTPSNYKKELLAKTV